MVQQLHEQQQQQQQQQHQQQDSTSTLVLQDMDSDKADAERRERIQRYKDERRKQIAARYGGAEWSSSEESGGDETSYRSYRRRRRAKDGQDTSSTEQSTLESRRGHENGSSLEGRGNRRLRGSSSEDVIQGIGRSSNRTARLRQSPLSHIAATNLLNDNVSADSNRNSPLPTPPTEGVSEVSSELLPLRRPTDFVAALDSPRGMIDSAESPLSGSDTRSGRRRGQGDKDKSNKRKSNLNRATTSEETADLYVLSQPSDSNEDTPRRRRRRAPLSPSGNSGLSTVIAPEPLKTPDVVRNVVARLTPPASPTPLQSPQLHPNNSFQPIQPADVPGSQSAPSTLNTRVRQAHGNDTRRYSGVTQDTNNVDTEEVYSRKHPPKLAPLRKPEIPDVLRPKDTSSLASPGVVNTPNNSRPSSVVLDKPPVGPEGLRPAALRSSLRKPPDAGTCFMASRREKVNETKPSTDNFLRELQQRPKKGDRLSKSDLNLKFDDLSPSGGSGASELEPALSSPSLLSPSKQFASSEENFSNRLDQISARARDTLERVDRLAVADCPSVPDSSPPEDSADNMVHECEEYLTVNASNKKDTGSGVVHRETKKSTSSKSIDQSSSLVSKKGVISDTGQKNWHGGSEGSSKESKRLVMEKEVNKELKKDYQVLLRDKFNSNASASPSGSPDNRTHKDDNNVEPPPDEVIHGLLRRKNIDNDTGSQDNSLSQSPEHRSKRGSRRCSLDGDSSRNNSPDPMSILKRKSSREDVAIERPTTPETHSILKRKTSSRNSSVDTSESDPISILKKKSSAEEIDMFEPRPILKKKSSTDDELDDRPRSILKGGRSREDLERLEGIVSPTPILKRSPRCDSDGEGEPERRSILKRRDTTDGVRLRLNVSDSEDVDGDTPSVRVRSDSAPEASSVRSRGRSPPAPNAVPSHSILKRRSHTSPGRMDQMDNELGAILRSRRSLASDDQGSDNEAPVNRPISPSLKSNNDGARPLSVAERIAGMEANKIEISPILRRSPSPNPCKSPGVRPKVRPISFERPPTPTDHDRVKNDAFLLVAEGKQNSDSSAAVEAVNSRMVESSADGVVLLDHDNSASSTDPQETPDTPSSVSQRAAFFAQLEREIKPESPTTPTRSARFGRRERSARCQTQPVTETEVCAAARLADTSDSASHDSDGPSASHNTSEESSKSMFRNAREAMMRSAEEVMAGLSGAVSPRKKYGSRRTSLNEPDEEQQPSDSAKSILKREGSREARDGPRSILKHHSTSSETRDSRRASYSETDNQDPCGEHPRGILKPESPLPPAMGSPEHEAKHVLKGVLKKDSSVEDPREIKSILKPQSHSLDPDHSSDSSSDDVTLTPSVIGNTSHKNDLAENVRQIDGVRREDKVEVIKADVQTTKVEHTHTKAEQKVIMDAAVKQAESIEDTHDLAEALRQIGPSRGVKDKHLEQDDKHKEGIKNIENCTKATRNTLSVSSSSSSTSSSETDMKHIKNDAVVRRRNAHTRRYDERRSMVEMRTLDSGGGSGTPADASSDSPTTLGDHQQETSSSSGADSADGGKEGSLTIPIPKSRSTMDAKQILAQSPIFRKQLSEPQDAKSQKATPDSQDVKTTSSLNARLAALQKSGSEGWKQKVNKENKDVNSNVTLRAKGGSSGRERPVSLFERMSQLETSSQSWKARVSPSDAAKFTVAHKMASSNSTSSVPALINSQASPDILPSTPPRGSPLMDRKKRSPQQKVFKSKTGGNLPSMLSRASPTSVRKSFRRSTSNPADADNTEKVVEGASVSVFRADDEDFTAFFTTSLDTSVTQIKEEVTLDEADLDHITSNTSQLLVTRRNVKMARRQRSARNPLKALAAREDIKSEYTEVKLGAGERELRRMKVDELSKSSNLAVEALAGLASKENFSAVSLKKVEDNPVVREMAPYSPLMLIQVKGRRWAQSRLVKPTVVSVNQGDDFILISQTDVFHYKGEFANVIERAKAAEIALYIIQTKDMGITTAKSVIEIDEHAPKKRKSKFWKLLGGDQSSCGQVCGPAEEDGFVEAALVAANKVYHVEEDSLIPVTDSWGQMPKVELLASDKTLVFDFGSELYVWSGKRADQTERRIGLALGRELWEEEYDYTDCDINPITPMLPHTEATLIGYRPEWGMCAKLTENVETILFKEKFIDWPDEAQQTRIKEVKQELCNQAAPVSELSACDAKELLDDLPLEPDLVLEMSHLGRGTEYYDEEERRQLTMSTEELEMWHISENDKEELNGESLNHLHSADSYVVRWKYHVTSTGRTLKGAPSKHNVTGRYRVAYFFWQGLCSSISDKGVAALMTVELDKERGPHVRVTQGQECPAFLNLFKSALVVHKGKRDGSPSAPWRLFLVRGEMELEAHLLEIEVDAAHLRSRGALVLINTQSGIVHLWYGAKALRHTRKIASVASEKLLNSEAIVEMGWKKGVSIKLKEQFEGAETRDFWEGFGGSRAKKHHFSLLEDENSYDWTPRMWHMVASHKEFQAKEVVSAFRATAMPNPLPFTQADLYSVTQPALFIIDGGHRVWVWQGWWPDESSPEDVAITGSATLRFNHSRRAALETALTYCQLKAKAQAKDKAKKINKKADENPPVIEPEVVIAGLEPLEFSNLFIHWTPREDIIQIQEQEGRWTKGEHYLVSTFLKQLCRTQYSLEEIKARPLPDGVDPLRLEVYLNEEDFFEALSMTREEFYNLQSWKQVDLKKKANLF